MNDVPPDIAQTIPLNALTQERSRTFEESRVVENARWVGRIKILWEVAFLQKAMHLSIRRIRSAISDRLVDDIEECSLFARNRAFPAREGNFRNPPEGEVVGSKNVRSLSTRCYPSRSAQ
jgi:hypothetical protein